MKNQDKFFLFVSFLCIMFDKIQTCAWKRFNLVELINTICLEGNINENVFRSIQADVDPALPLITLGLLSFVHAFLTLGLPETLNQELPETLQEGNDFGKEQSFWWIPCISS